MLGFIVGVMRARAVRPLLLWTMALLAYVVAPISQGWVLLLIVGLGVALAATVSRLREGGRGATAHVTHAWNIAERLTAAVEDRIRATPPGPPLHTEPPQYASPALGYDGAAYDPGALLSAVVAVLAAEGLPTNAGPALPACAQLLTWQGIGVQPGVSAPAALALATGLSPGQQRRHRAMPAGLLASVIRTVLTADQVLPAAITTDDADALIDASAHILHALGIAVDDTAGPLQAWPFIAELITAAPLPPPCDPPASPYRYQ